MPTIGEVTMPGWLAPLVAGFSAACGCGGAALAVHQLGQNFNVHFESHAHLINTIYAPAKYYGDTPEQVALSIGRSRLAAFSTNRKCRTSAWICCVPRRSAKYSSNLLKLATRREPPDASNHLSFPSGHSR